MSNLSCYLFSGYAPLGWFKGKPVDDPIWNQLLRHLLRRASVLQLQLAAQNNCKDDLKQHPDRLMYSEYPDALVKRGLAKDAGCTRMPVAQLVGWEMRVCPNAACADGSHFNARPSICIVTSAVLNMNVGQRRLRIAHHPNQSVGHATARDIHTFLLREGFNPNQTLYLCLFGFMLVSCESCSASLPF